MRPAWSTRRYPSPIWKSVPASTLFRRCRTRSKRRRCHFLFQPRTVSRNRAIRPLKSNRQQGNVMSNFKPFKNEEESLIIDDLTIENRLDRVSLYGSVQLTRDKTGLQQARQLQAGI